MRHAGTITPAWPVLEIRGPRGLHPLASLLARVRAPSLDRQLAAGVEPWRTPTHAARSRQLTSDRARRSFARSLERLVETVDAPRTPFLSAAVPPSRARVREARPQLLTLACRLRGNAPVDPRGMTALRELLADGSGPIYTPGDPATLGHRLQTIEDWLDAQD